MNTRLAIGIDPGSGVVKPNLALAFMVNGKLIGAKGWKLEDFELESMIKKQVGTNKIVEETFRILEQGDRLRVGIAVEEPFLAKNFKVSKGLARYGEFARMIVLHAIWRTSIMNIAENSIILSPPITYRPGPKTWQKICLGQGNLKSVDAKLAAMEHAKKLVKKAKLRMPDGLTQDQADAICIADYADLQLQQELEEKI